MRRREVLVHGVEGTARPSSNPTPAITHMPCGSIQIRLSRRRPIHGATEEVARAGTSRRPSRGPWTPGPCVPDRSGCGRRPPPIRGAPRAPQFLRGQDELPRDEHRLGHSARSAGDRLERLAGLLGERVQVETVVPVGPADQRQTVGAEPVRGEGEGPAADARIEGVSVRARCRTVPVRPGPPVAGLLHVGRDREDQPERVVVEPRPDRVVPRFVSGLVLVVRARRQLVAARSRIRSRARSGTMCTKPRRSGLESRNPMPRPIPVSNDEADRDRLNVAMHWYGFQTFTIRSTCSLASDPHDVEELGPSVAQPLERARRSRHRAGSARSPGGRAAVEPRRSRRGELRIRRVLPVAEQEDDLAGLVRRQLELHLVRGDRRPAVGDRVPRPPTSTTVGRSQPRYGPRNASRCVSNPDASSEHAK